MTQPTVSSAPTAPRHSIQNLSTPWIMNYGLVQYYTVLVLITMNINSRSLKNSWGDSSAAERSSTDVSVKHCTIFIIVADDSTSGHPCYPRLHAFIIFFNIVLLTLSSTNYDFFFRDSFIIFFFRRCSSTFGVGLLISCSPAVQVFYDWFKKEKNLNWCVFMVFWVNFLLYWLLTS